MNFFTQCFPRLVELEQNELLAIDAFFYPIPFISFPRGATYSLTHYISRFSNDLHGNPYLVFIKTLYAIRVEFNAIS